MLCGVGKIRFSFFLKSFLTSSISKEGPNVEKAENNLDNNVRNSEIVEFHNDLTEAQDTSASNYTYT